MGTRPYDVFVSYRREDSADRAALVKSALERRGLRVFLDVRLGAGPYDEALLRAIESAPDFIVILTPRSLERCSNEGDWLTQEIAHALGAKRNIVPLISRDFVFPAPAGLPERIRPLGSYQAVPYDHLYGEEAIERLWGMLTSAARLPARRRRTRWGIAALALPLLTGALLAGAFWRSRLTDRTLNMASGEAAYHTAFKSLRPAGSSAATGVDPAYRLGTPPLPVPASAVASDALLGVTILRLRASAASDERAIRLLVHEAAGSVGEWTPVRVDAHTALGEGDRIRLAIESARMGFLYVVDRERYADGNAGDPYLVFPTLRTRGGQNDVAPGQLIELPAWDDTPPYFTLRRSRPDHTGETLTVVVTPQPIPGLRIGRQPLKLAADEVVRWERSWAARTERLDAADGGGRPYTRAEREAAAEGTRLLTQDEPLPQAIYRVAAPPGVPLLVIVPLGIGRYKSSE